jgi:hypothetical protein
MEERTFLHEGGVKVTNARVLVGSQTYAMSGVTSVKHSMEAAKRGFSLICFLIGAGTLYYDHRDTNPILIGAVAIVIGIVAWILKKDKHFVILHSSSGESRAVMHTDRGFINRVIQAINNAIVSRG